MRFEEKQVVRVKADVKQEGSLWPQVVKSGAGKARCLGHEGVVVERGIHPIHGEVYRVACDIESLVWTWRADDLKEVP